MGLVNNANKTQSNTSQRQDDDFDFFSDSAPAGVAKKVNPEEDAWARSPIPPKGTYSLQLFVGEGKNKGISPSYNRKTKEFEAYTIAIMFKVVNASEEYNDAIGYGRVSTRIGRGKNNSTAVALLTKLGYNVKADKEYTDKQVAATLVKALEKSPVLEGNECDWRASYEKDNGQWENVYNSMDEFPKDEDGNPEPKVTLTSKDGTPKTISAQFNVVKWGGKELVAGGSGGVAEAPKVVTPAPKATPKVTPKAKVVEPEPEVEVEVDDTDDEMMMLE